eukprot:TRINITY_DN14974_c0_g1_i1.p1 TRINITY_DN14974_c0_g1~~TRINITY_DN14974_c0_g1_i1.p1  ORF type:complete len:173 (+),score=55.27 TRINITY_DN14974_c0_g1_i1:64-519(+)
MDDDMSLTNISMAVGGGVVGGGLMVKRLIEEKEEIERKLKDVEKIKDRVMQISKKKITEFREAVYQLFGWKIEYFEEGRRKRFRLKSMYSERENDYLMFEKEGKGFDLLGTDFSERLDDEVQTYLVKCNSIPAFVCNVTVDLFNRTTFKMG